MIARIEPDGSGVGVWGIFKGRRVLKSWKVCKWLAEGDVIEDIGMTARGDKLIALEKACPVCGGHGQDPASDAGNASLRCSGCHGTGKEAK